VSRVVDTNDVTFEGVAITDDHIEVNTWGNSYSDADTAMQAIHALFDNYQGALSDGTRILSTTSTTHPDMYEQDSELFRCCCTFQFLY